MNTQKILSMVRIRIEESKKLNADIAKAISVNKEINGKVAGWNADLLQFVLGELAGLSAKIVDNVEVIERIKERQAINAEFALKALNGKAVDYDFLNELVAENKNSLDVLELALTHL